MLEPGSAEWQRNQDLAMYFLAELARIDGAQYKDRVRDTGLPIDMPADYHYAQRRACVALVLEVAYDRGWHAAEQFRVQPPATAAVGTVRT